MSNILGNSLTLTIFGESHGPCIGGVIDGLPAGLAVDTDYIARELSHRRSISSISTPRTEDDTPEFLSGIRDGHTEGTPVAFIIRNRTQRSSDYDRIRGIARPGHADYTAQMKYDGYQDASGGGHFSGRLTAVIVTAGAIVRKALEDRGILIGSHISELGGIRDRDIDWNDPEAELASLNDKMLAVLSDDAASQMIERIEAARDDRDSVGGILETVILGLEPGIGEPIFGSIESEISRAVFSVGAVKGVEFGSGFAMAGMRGSEANDGFRIRGGRIVTETNHNGGINGGISNGMPVVFRTVIKPTPSISKPQHTVNFLSMEETDIEIGGRHDPAVVHRARSVIDDLTAFVTADLICQRYGYGWLL